MLQHGKYLGNVIIIGIIANLIFVSCEEVKNNGSNGKPNFKINNVAGPTKGACGEVEWKVSFELNETSDSGGYFVQKIRMHRNATKECPTKYNEIDKTYYEAWKVNKNKKVTKYLQKNPNTYDDMYAWPSWPNSEGFNNHTGVLKYFEDLALPKDFKKHNPKTFAGILPSTTSKPKFWDNNKGKTHNLEGEWDCCDDSTTTVETIPDFTEKEEEKKPTKGGKFFQYVEALKPWTDGAYTQQDNNELRWNAQELQKLSTSEIMTGIEEYTQYYNGRIEPMSKLYLMMRMIFDVPQNTSMDQAKNFGGWIKPEQQVSGEQTSLLWPLGYNENSQLTVKHNFMGYSGSVYDAPGEAMYFMENYGRREQ